MKFSEFVNNIIGIINYIAIFIVSCAVLVFLYGMLNYMINIGDEAKRQESIKYITSGLLGLFIMVSLWSIVLIITRTFGFDSAIPMIFI